MLIIKAKAIFSEYINRSKKTCLLFLVFNYSKFYINLVNEKSLFNKLFCDNKNFLQLEIFKSIKSAGSSL